MLLKFTLSNYRSFKETASINMEAHGIKDHAENVCAAKFGTQPVKVLKSIVLFGVNSSGKSNMLSAFDLMRHMVINSVNETALNKTHTIEPFYLSTEKENKPTVLECTMMIKNTAYRYGFKCNNTEILSEWLYVTVKRREEIIFTRTKSDFNIVKRFPGPLKNKMLMLCDITRENALYITVLSQFNMEMARQITQWFSKNKVYTDACLNTGISYIAELLYDTSCKILMNEIINKFNLGFAIVEKQAERCPKNTHQGTNGAAHRQAIMMTRHVKYDDKEKRVDEVLMPLNKSGSSGTTRLIAILGPVIKVLIDGGVCWIDDFDAKIYPDMVNGIMDLFSSNEYNPKRAQLMATSGNPQIFTKLRRDQVLFCNKDVYGTSSVSASNQYKSLASNMVGIYNHDYLQAIHADMRSGKNKISVDLKPAKTKMLKQVQVSGF